jgi:hypothetical protein
MSDTLKSVKTQLVKAKKRQADDFQRLALLRAGITQLKRKSAEQQKNFTDQQKYLAKYVRGTDKEFDILEEKSADLVNLIDDILKGECTGATSKKYSNYLDNILSRYDAKIHSHRNYMSSI